MTTVPVANNESRLWYRQPAQSWLEALPLGNGRLGAMIGMTMRGLMSSPFAYRARSTRPTSRWDS